LVPKSGQCENLLVPVCVSSSHIAFGSIRMEPVFMILGQSAATAACMAMDDGIAVQQLNYPKLRARLLADQQILDPTQLPPTSDTAIPTPAAKLEGIVLDDTDGVKSGDWHDGSLRSSVRVGTGYVHDGNTNKGGCALTFTPEIPHSGEFEIFLVFPPNANRASNVPVTITIQPDTIKTVLINQKPTRNNGIISLGKYRLTDGKNVSVQISNKGTDGYVVVDGLQLVSTAETATSKTAEP